MPSPIHPRLSNYDYGLRFLYDLPALTWILPPLRGWCSIGLCHRLITLQSARNGGQVNKPTTCLGCPLYGDGKGFVPDQLVAGSHVMIIAQNPGQDEERQSVPMVGKTGQMMDEQFIPLAGLERSQVSVGNILKCRQTLPSGRKTNDMPEGETLQRAVDQCVGEHLTVPEHVSYIIAQGAHAFRVLGGGLLTRKDQKQATLHDWRGHILPEPFRGKPVYVVGHLADLHYDPKNEFVATLDWRKVASILDGTWPKPVPTRLIVQGNTVDWPAVLGWFEGAKQNASIIACDTEYIGPEHYLTVLGLGYKSDSTVHGLQLDWRSIPGHAKGKMAALVRRLVHDVPFLFQNFDADMPVLKRWLGVPYDSYKCVHDTMLAHAVLWCELPHDLEFLASIYGQYRKLKHVSGNLLLYNWGDVLETLATWDGLQTGLQADPAAKKIYEDQSLQLIPIILRAHEEGISVDTQRVATAIPVHEGICRDASLLAQAYIGWPINLGSDDQVGYHLYQELGLPVQIKRKTKSRTVDDDAVAVLRDIVGPPFDPQQALDFTLAWERIQRGANPVLEMRVVYGKAQHILDNYLYPLRGLGRVHPHFAIHAQKTGRWSTTKPPLATLPPALRDILVPDPDTVWISWDWSSIEPRILEGHCRSQILRRAFDENIDLHTWSACIAFGLQLPPNLIDPHGAPECEQWRAAISWRGKDDPRRIFAKSGRYEMYYGGVGANAAAAAVRMGLDADTVRRALAGFITADVEYFMWRKGVENLVGRTRLLRSFMGRPRRFLGKGQHAIRQALDYPMQAGVSDIFNTTAIRLAHSYPFLSFKYGMHDSQTWQCPAANFSEGLVVSIREIVEQPYEIDGRLTKFPASFHVTQAPTVGITG